MITIAARITISLTNNTADMMDMADEKCIKKSQYMNKECTDGKTIFHFEDDSHLLFHADDKPITLYNSKLPKWAK